jgi:DNA-binding NtrC family response regulator
VNELATISEKPARQDCPWCGTMTAVKRPVTQEELPHLIAQFVRDLLAGGAVHTHRPEPLEARAPKLREVPAIQRPLPQALDTLERQHIVDVLRQVSGNRMAAAKMLGISRRALYRRLERYQLVDEVPRLPVGRRI